MPPTNRLLLLLVGCRSFQNKASLSCNPLKPKFKNGENLLGLYYAKNKKIILGDRSFLWVPMGP